MKTSIFIVLLLLLISCRYEANKIPKVKDASVQDNKTGAENDEEDKINDSVYLLKKFNKEGKFYLYYSKDAKENVSFDSIIIENKFNKKTQKIKFKKDYFLFSYEVDFSVEEDVNFDGFDDIKVINYAGNYNSRYSFWLYKNKEQNYKHVNTLDSIYNPVFDHTKKEIYSEWRIAFQSYYYEKYFWKKDQVILKEQRIENVTNSPDTMNVYTRKLVNGKYIEKEVNIKL